MEGEIEWKYSGNTEPEGTVTVNSGWYHFLLSIHDQLHDQVYECLLCHTAMFDDYAWMECVDEPICSNCASSHEKECETCWRAWNGHDY